ncbi:cysteine-rich receptor-like protein kinase 25 [Alnus glutinosa]|uniref:cysteine-rich receptor-like protein kinase 25 n=1 Tax=Alnus glutinosa TaxID=3517 RepID=UPI002D79F190|nr:cysteine-rich receptor-like protein kinase 25 [Alnus glutinosa]
MLRYSNRSILGVMETNPSFYMSNPKNVSAYYVNQFKNDLRTLLESLRSQAAAGGSDLKFAAGNATAPMFQTLYAFVQCTPDLSELDCNNCLLEAFQDIPLCCDGKQGGRVIRPSCNIRFEFFPFYSPTTAASPIRPTNEDKREVFAADDSKRSSIFVINIIFVLIVIASMVLCISMGVYFSVKRLRNNDGTTNESTSIELESLQVDHGSEANKKLGQGGYSAIYKKYTQIKKKLSSMRKKKDASFVTPNIKEENEIQELISDLPMPDGFLESDDDYVSQLLKNRLRSLRGLQHSVVPSLSSSSPSSRHVSQLNSELDEYKLRCEEAERKVNRQREKISSVRKEMQEEVNSMKRQQAQQQQEMEAKQRQMEQKIEFLLSQLQLPRDPPT